MDNKKDNHYYVKKLIIDLSFIIEHTKNKSVKTKINIDKAYKIILIEAGVKIEKNIEFEPYGYFISQIG